MYVISGALVATQMLIKNKYIQPNLKITKNELSVNCFYARIFKRKLLRLYFPETEENLAKNSYFILEIASLIRIKYYMERHNLIIKWYCLTKNYIRFTWFAVIIFFLHLSFYVDIFLIIEVGIAFGTYTIVICNYMYWASWSLLLLG